MFPVHVFDPFHVHHMRSALCPKNQKATDYECQRDRHRMKQVLLDGFDEQQTQNCGWQKRDQEIQHEAICILTGADVRHYMPQLDAIFPAYRQNRAKLNDDGKYLALVVIEVEQIADQNQVTSGRNRKKFRQTFDYAKDEPLEEKKPVHSRLSSRSRETASNRERTGMNHGVTREYRQWVSSREVTPRARLFIFSILSHQTG